MKNALKRFLVLALFVFASVGILACTDETTTIPQTTAGTTSTVSGTVTTTGAPTTTTDITTLPQTTILTTDGTVTTGENYYDLSVRDAKGFNGMVASASPDASIVGIDILKAGGNAFDAAVAIAFALNVTEPNASGVGGGGMMIGYSATTDESFVYDYREFAPAGATRELYINNASLDTGDGPGSFGIPMFVDGMLTVLEDYGTMSRSDVIEPAVDLARNGFTVSPTLAYNISSQFSKLMRSRTEALKVYSTDGLSPISEGETLINADLANVLDLIISNGREGFYTGDLALAIVQAVNAAAANIGISGGLITMQDMQRAIGLTEKMTPVIGTYNDYEIYSMMPPGSGISIVEIFNIIEQYNLEYGDISELEHNSAEYVHVIGSAMQLAYGDRRRYTGDPAFVDVPLIGLTSKAYAEERLTLNFDPLVGQTFSGYGAGVGDPWPHNTTPDPISTTPSEDGAESGSTTHFTVIDSDGNIVSATHTINYFFGNGIIPAGTGIHLNNILSPFSTTDGSIACIAPYKQPLSSMAPTIVLKDGEPFMAVGSPGSLRIPAAIIQVMLNVMEFDMDVQTAIEQPRVFHYAASNMEIEGAIGASVIADLIAMGYTPNVHTGTDLYFGGVHSIVIDPDTGEMHGGADRRRDGKAIGY